MVTKHNRTLGKAFFVFFDYFFLTWENLFFFPSHYVNAEYIEYIESTLRFFYFFYVFFFFFYLLIYINDHDFELSPRINFFLFTHPLSKTRS